MSQKITPDLPPPPHKGLYVERYTNIIQLRMRAKRTGGVVYYGINTCWWTTDPAELYSLKPRELTINGNQVMAGGLPCDPRGGMLMEAHNVDIFFDSAVANANVSHYGKHGLRAFIAAHHGNVIVSVDDPRPTCFASWDDYNRLLEEFDARQGGKK